MTAENSKALFDKALDWIFRSKFQDVKARIAPFEGTKTFHSKRMGTSFTPDLSATRNGNKSFFEIVRNKEPEQQLAEKWQLLQTIAQRTGGKLYLFTPKGFKAFAEQLTGKFCIDAKIIYLA